MVKIMRFRCAAGVTIAALIFLSIGRVDAADTVNSPERRSIGELSRTAVIHLGKTADWVSITSPPPARFSRRFQPVRAPGF